MSAATVVVVSTCTAATFCALVARAFGDPVEAVHHRKQRELVKSAHVWIDRHGRAEESYRFDVVGVLLDGERVLVKHVEDAFRV